MCVDLDKGLQIFDGDIITLRSCHALVIATSMLGRGSEVVKGCKCAN